MSDQDKYFARPKTNADKAALIVLLVNGHLPDYGETDLDALCWAFVTLTGAGFETAKKAFEDAQRFGFITVDHEQDNMGNI